jgi:NADPH:quinone reductase-like Zn-dependent oxidoreductase
MKIYTLPMAGEARGMARQDRDMPTPGQHDVVIRVKAASLNKRDLFIQAGTYPIPARQGVVPLSDGAGEVVATGERVTRFRVGDRVAENYFARWKTGPLAFDLFDQLRCTLDGMLAEYAVLNEEWAVHVPAHLTWQEAATLPCAGVTAWNSVIGPVPVTAGQTVLTLGSGGVSLFALQFAKLSGARVIATTSSDEKGERLKGLGADVVINYNRQPEWGKAVREATGGAGVDLVVETFGADTIEQSMCAIGLHGQVMLLIARGVHKPHIEISSQAYGATMATLRRVFVGNRASFEAMNKAITQARMQPVIDKVFPFEDAPAAYEYFARGQSFGKVVISME